LYVKVAKRNVYNYKGDKISAVRVIWRDSKWYVAYGGLLTVASQVDLLSMYHFFPLDQVGVYALALKIFSVSMLGIAALQSVLLPRLATAHGREELESLFWRMVRLSVPIAMFAGFFLIVAAKYIVLIVGGEKFLGAVTPFRVLSLAIAESILLSTHSQFLMVAKRYLSLLLSGVVYFLTSVILSYTLIRAFGSVGAAFAVLGSLLITHLFVTSSVVFMFRSHQPIPT
jgi:O-antigen/teichoic acid export membrane protein